MDFYVNSLKHNLKNCILVENCLFTKHCILLMDILYIFNNIIGLLYLFHYCYFILISLLISIETICNISVPFTKYIISKMRILRVSKFL